jgi:hypothetical protein
MSQVPLRLRLVLEFLTGELLGAVREVPAEDHHVRPVVPDQVGNGVGEERVLPGRPREGREHQVVLADLLTDLPADDLQVLANLGHRLLALAVLGGLQAVCRNASFEQGAE